MTERATGLFEAERPRLVGLAYRLLGSLVDAEDVVQEAWFRYERATDLDVPQAWLTTVVSRLSLDRLRARKRDRSTYVGPWLPEPIVRPPDPEETVEISDSLTTAFLVLLEELDAEERLVVLLADVFGEPFRVVAEITGRTEESCRQLASRARRRLRAAAPAPRVRRAEQVQIAGALLAAVLNGDEHAVIEMLDPDVRLVSDGGAARHAARRPIVGAERVARFLVNIAKRLVAVARFEPATVNGAPGLVGWVGATPVIVFGIDVVDGRVSSIYGMLNPDKLGHVGHPIPLA